MSLTSSPTQSEHWRRIGYGALVGVALIALILLAQLLDRAPRTITDTWGDATVSFTVEPGRVFLPGESISVHWETVNNREVYYNDVGKVGVDEEIIVVDLCNDQPSLRVVFDDDNEIIYTLPISIWVLDSTTWLGIWGIFVLLLVAGYGLQIPVLSSISQNFAGLISWRGDEQIQRNQRFLLRLFSLLGVVLLAVYALIPFCNDATTLSLAEGHPVHVGLYGLVWVLSLVVLFGSFSNGAGVVSIFYNLVQRVPFWLLVVIVLAMEYFLLMLVAFWGLGIPFVNVLPLVVWIGLAGYFILLFGVREQQDAFSVPTFVNRWVVLVAGLLLWIVVWKVGWQEIVSHYWLRSLVGFVAYLVPGILFQQFFFMDKPFQWVRALTLGFAVSLGLVGTVGVVGRLFLFSSDLVMNIIFGMGIVLMVMLVLRWQKLPTTKIQKPSPVLLAMFLLGVAAIVLSSRLPFAWMNYESLNLDYRTYNGYATIFADAGQYNFDDAFMNLDGLSSSRDWLAFWTLGQAVMVEVSGNHTQINFWLLGAWTSIIAFLSVFGLARTLRFSDSLAWLAVIGTFFGIVFTLGRHEAGYSFLERVHQDKIIAAFIFAPVWFRVLIAFLRTPRLRGAVLLLVILAGLLYAHPVSLAMVALMSFFYLVIDALFQREWRWRLGMVLLFGIALLPPMYIRFAHYAHTIYTQEGLDEQYNDEQPERYVERVYRVEGTPFYGLTPEILDGVGYGVVYLAGLVALTQIRKRESARYVLAGNLLVLVAFIPVTAWLVGLGVSATQVWRLPWLVPFGISIAFLVQILLEDGIPRLQPRFARHGHILIPVVGVLLLTAGILEVSQYHWFQQDIEAVRAGGGDAVLTRNEALVALGDSLDVTFSEPTVILADANLTNHIPSLSANAKTFTYRKRQNGEYDAWLEFFQGDSNETRLAILDEWGLGYILFQGENVAIQSLLDEYPDDFTLLFYVPPYQLYQYGGG